MQAFLKTFMLKNDAFVRFSKTHVLTCLCEHTVSAVMTRLNNIWAKNISPKTLQKILLMIPLNKDHKDLFFILFGCFFNGVIQLSTNPKRERKIKLNIRKLKIHIKKIIF